MAALTKTKQVTYNANLVQNKSHVMVARINEVTKLLCLDWKNPHEVHWTKYEIKETDMRQKTATFSSPNYFDLTTGVYVVLITSPYHANFGGAILSVEYDEDTGMYDYKCQDFSRFYQHKIYMQTKKLPLYRVLQWLITKSNFDIRKKPSKKFLKSAKPVLSGLRPAKYYDQKIAGSIASFNPMTQKISVRAKDKSYIELIRDLVIGTGAYIDVYFDVHGILQIEPYHKKEWLNTGLHLTTKEIANRKFGFDTTNIITGVNIVGDDDKSKQYTAKDLTNVDLSAFFGNLYSFIDNTSSTTSNDKSNNSNKNTSNKQSTTVTLKDNPYGNKAKKIWIGADGGSGSFTQEICRLLEKNGWHTHYSGEGANVHWHDYFDVTSDYQIMAIVDNGVCCSTIKEAYESSDCAPALKRKGVIPMFMFDSRSWTNPKVRGPNRYGNFKGTVVHTAYDDPSGYCQVMHVDDFFRKHKAVYCAAPTAKGMVDMFLKGGYYASKGIQV